MDKVYHIGYCILVCKMALLTRVLGRPSVARDDWESCIQIVYKSQDNFSLKCVRPQGADDGRLYGYLVHWMLHQLYTLSSCTLGLSFRLNARASKVVLHTTTAASCFSIQSSGHPEDYKFIFQFLDLD